MLCHIYVVVNLSFGLRSFKRCFTFRKNKLQAAVNHADLFKTLLTMNNGSKAKDVTLIP